MHVPLSRYDPQLRRWVRPLRWLLGHNQSVEALRQGGSGIARLLPRGRRTPRGISIAEEFVERPDGSLLRLLVFAPLTKTTALVPGIVHIHGGGYALGSAANEAGTAQQMLTHIDAVVVSPEYRLSGEAPYPAALDDCYLALTWMRDNAGRLGIRTDQLVVGGFSAGGGLAAALSLLARDRGTVNIAFQYPVFPMLDDRDTPSNSHSDDPVWDSTTNRSAWQLYLGDLYGTEEVPAYAAPARSTALAHLPPTLTFVGDLDPFYDETRAYVAALRAANVPTEFETYRGAYHGFHTLPKSARVSQAATAWFNAQLRHFTQTYFAKQPPP